MSFPLVPSHPLLLLLLLSWAWTPGTRRGQQQQEEDQEQQKGLHHLASPPLEPGPQQELLRWSALLLGLLLLVLLLELVLLLVPLVLLLAELLHWVPPRVAGWAQAPLPASALMQVSQAAAAPAAAAGDAKTNGVWARGLSARAQGPDSSAASPPRPSATTCSFSFFYLCPFS
jgi:hypothetical protein